eukprot:1880834-Alexandrium_andersonii.AAC.1
MACDAARLLVRPSQVLSHGSEVFGNSASLGGCALGPCAAHRAVLVLRAVASRRLPFACARVAL